MDDLHAKEMTPVERVAYRGIEYLVDRPKPDLRLLTALNYEGDGEYIKSLDPIRGLNIQGVKLIRDIGLPQFEKKAPIFSCAVVPNNKFLQVTQIPQNFDWATICSRGIWRKDGEDAVVASSRHASKIDFPTNGLFSLNGLTEAQTDVVREVVHEHLPTLRDTYLPYPSATALPLSEAMDETVPRYVLGMQSKMPKSTAFLSGLKDKEILTVENLWGGFSQHSFNRVSENPAYGSAFLLGVGLIKRLQEKYGVDQRQAISIWLDSMISASSGLDVVTKLADKLEFSKDLIQRGKTLQMEGQEVIKTFLK